MQVSFNFFFFSFYFKTSSLGHRKAKETGHSEKLHTNNPGCQTTVKLGGADGKECSHGTEEGARLHSGILTPPTCFPPPSNQLCENGKPKSQLILGPEQYLGQGDCQRPPWTWLAVPADEGGSPTPSLPEGKPKAEHGQHTVGDALCAFATSERAMDGGAE